MKVAVDTGPVVRRADPRDVDDAGALTAEAYVADGLLRDEGDYTAELRDAQRRAREAILLVAAVPRDPGGGAEPDRADDVVVGTVTLAPYGTSYAEVAEPGELEVRMLAVAPEARGRGVAEALMTHALRHAVAEGARRVVLSTSDDMQAAQRLYDRLGFVHDESRDWSHHRMCVRVCTWTPPDAPGAVVEAATWPPLRTTVTSDGWRVGESGGLTRRANSTLPLTRAADTGAAVDEVEAVYRAAGLPAIVRVGPATGGPALHEALLARGYAAVSRADVLVRDVDGPSPHGLGGADVRVATHPDDAWLTAWLGVKSAGADMGTARAILDGSPGVYLTALDAGRPVGVIRAAFAEDWVGLSCLVVVPEARRRGLARTLTMRALNAARTRGARRAFLQVEPHNSAAARLYTGLGFAPADRYLYLERPLTPA